MQFKAVIFDLDGTAIPTKLNAIPSFRLINSIKKAQKLVRLSAATGRSTTTARKILQTLNLIDPCIVCGGTQIINPKTEITLWEKRLTELQVKKIIKVCKPYPYEVIFSDEAKGATAMNKIIKGSERIIYVMATKEKDAELILEELNKIDGIAANLPGSWTKNRMDIHITNKLATKKNAVEKLIKLLNIDKRFVLGVGDRDNDLPLFESVGYKVAMGDGTEKLKNAADYIAPSVENDGLAKVIEKFILQV